MRTAIATAARLALPALLLVASGCAQLGSLENVLGGMGGMGGTGGGSGQISGEVRHVDARSQQIEIADSRSGQRAVVAFDNRTEVIYRQQRYAVTNLEAGDLVAMEVQQDSRGRLYAQRVHVQQSVQERSGGGVYGGGSTQQPGQVQRFEGRVSWVDANRGQFGVDAGYSGTLTVTLPYNPASGTVDRFRRLRQGDVVRFEGEMVNQGRVELTRFY